MSEPDRPKWARGLHKKGLYYEGLVDNHEEVIELHRKHTMTTYGTRTSSRTSGEGKENKVLLYYTKTYNMQSTIIFTTIKILHSV